MNTLLAFLVTLAILIVVHEWGHYRMARAVGVKVLRFSVGFGPVILRRQRTPDSTEFVLSAVPLGGYVRMLDEREDQVSPAMRDQAFNNKALWQRAAVVAAGPVANLLLAVVLYAASQWIGVDEPKALVAAPPNGSLAHKAGLRAGDWVREVSSDDGQAWREVRSMPDLTWALVRAVNDHEALSLRVSDNHGRGQRELRLATDSVATLDSENQWLKTVGLGGAWREPVLGDVSAGGAGAAAGLRPRDRVLSVDGAIIEDAAQITERVRASVQAGVAREMLWRIDRSGQLIELPVMAKVVTDKGQTFGRIEVAVGSPPETVKVQYGPIDGLMNGARRVYETTTMSLQMFGRMLIGQASLKNLSGPLTIADYAGQSSRMGITYFLDFLAMVSVGLGVLNLLPLPMLDGGHLMYYLFEAVTGRPVSEWWLKWLQRGGALMLLLIMSIALSNDVVRQMGLH